MNKSPYRAIAKWLAETLRPTENKLNRHIILDWFDFVNSKSSVNVTGKMISLDITSLLQIYF